jgi:hypothetical protein
VIGRSSSWLIARRPSAFQAGHIPSWRKFSERYALPTVAADSGWLLLLLSPLLSAQRRYSMAIRPRPQIRYANTRSVAALLRGGGLGPRLPTDQPLT